MSHLGELTITSDIMEWFCRTFPEYIDQMKVFIQHDTGDASLCRTALSVLESFVTLLQQLMDGKTDLRQLIEDTLVDENGHPRTAHGQRPSELLVELAEKGDSTYQRYHKLEDNKAKELYNKMRNRYQMRCSRAPGNQKMRDNYNAWRKQAQLALSKYQLGEISWEEFEEILKLET